MKLTTRIKLNRVLYNAENKLVGIKAEVAHPRKIEKSMYPTLLFSKYSETDKTSYLNECYYMELNASYDEKTNENVFFIRKMSHINNDSTLREDLGFITKYIEIKSIKKFDIVDIDGKDRFVFYKLMVNEINAEKAKPIAVWYFKDDLKYGVGDRVNLTMCLSCKRKYDDEGHIDETDKYMDKQNWYSCLEAIKIRRC